MSMVSVEKTIHLIEGVEDFSPTKTKILLYLFKVKRDTTSQIAKAINYGGGGYTRHLEALKDKGLIKRIARGLYEITIKGEEHIKSVVEPEFTDLPEEERRMRIIAVHGEKIPEDLIPYIELYKKGAVSKERAVSPGKISIKGMVKDLEYKKIDRKIYLTDIGVKIAKGAVGIWET